MISDLPSVTNKNPYKKNRRKQELFRIGIVGVLTFSYLLLLMLLLGKKCVLFLFEHCKIFLNIGVRAPSNSYFFLKNKVSKLFLNFANQSWLLWIECRESLGCACWIHLHTELTRSFKYTILVSCFYVGGFNKSPRNWQCRVTT